MIDKQIVNRSLTIFIFSFIHSLYQFIIDIKIFHNIFLDFYYHTRDARIYTSIIIRVCISVGM